MTADRPSRFAPSLGSVVAVVLVLTSVVCVLLWNNARRDDSTTAVPPAPVAAAAGSVGAPRAPRIDAARRATAAPHRSHRRRDSSDVPPAVLGIPSIDVATPVIDLGLQPDGTVEVPEDPALAGWFEPGTVPGAVGSSVILGHVDSQSGPAVFYRLGELTAGDVVWIRRDDHTAAKFVVRSVRTYGHDQFPAQRLYAAPHRRRVLNLVTCGGAYDPDRGGYQANVVVHARRA